MPDLIDGKIIISRGSALFASGEKLEIDSAPKLLFSDAPGPVTLIESDEIAGGHSFVAQGLGPNAKSALTLTGQSKGGSYKIHVIMERTAELRLPLYEATWLIAQQ